MCSGDRLIADFVAGTGTRPELPEVLEEHLTTTMDGLWVVWAYKLARQMGGDRFIPLSGGPGYPADARAICKYRRGRRGHDAPDPRCTCGFHALSSRTYQGLPFASVHFTALTVVLSGRVLACEWAGGGALWRAERQTVVRVEQPTLPDWTEFDGAERVQALRSRSLPDDPDGRLGVVPTTAPRDSGPVRLSLPVSVLVLPVCHDDAGWCLATTRLDHSRAALVLA